MTTRTWPQQAARTRAPRPTGEGCRAGPLRTGRRGQRGVLRPLPRWGGEPCWGGARVNQGTCRVRERPAMEGAHAGERSPLQGSPHCGAHAALPLDGWCWRGRRSAKADAARDLDPVEESASRGGGRPAPAEDLPIRPMGGPAMGLWRRRWCGWRPVATRCGRKTRAYKRKMV